MTVMPQIELEKFISLTESLGYCVPKVILTSWYCGWLDQGQLVGYAQDYLVELGDRTTDEWVQIAASFEETRDQIEFLNKIVSRMVERFSEDVPLIKEIVRVYFLEVVITSNGADEEGFFSCIEEIRAGFGYPDDMRFISSTPIWIKDEDEKKEWLLKSPITEARQLVDTLKGKLKTRV